MRNGVIHHDPLSIKSLLLYQLSYAGNLVKSYQSRIDVLDKTLPCNLCQLLTKKKCKKKRVSPPALERIVIKQYALTLLHAFDFVKSSEVVPIDNIEWRTLEKVTLVLFVSEHS